MWVFLFQKDWTTKNSHLTVPGYENTFHKRETDGPLLFSKYFHDKDTKMRDSFEALRIFEKLGVYLLWRFEAFSLAKFPLIKRANQMHESTARK